MAGTAMTPYAQLVGPVDVYVAPYGTAEPAIDAAVPSTWYKLGPTTGDQTIEHSGDLEVFRDNDHQGPVKVTRPEEDLMVTFTVVDMTYEKYARIINDVGKIATSTSGSANVKRLPFKRGATPTNYALLMRGSADSPYGLYPGQNYIPRCVQSGNPAPARGKATRAELECEFMTLEDDAQASDDDKMGWGTVQIS